MNNETSSEVKIEHGVVEFGGSAFFARDIGQIISDSFGHLDQIVVVIANNRTVVKEYSDRGRRDEDYRYLVDIMRGYRQTVVTAKDILEVPGRPSDALLPCPFCGGEPEVERKGTMRASQIIVCEDCGCRLECGDIWGSGHYEWNFRMRSDDQSAREAQKDALLDDMANPDLVVRIDAGSSDHQDFFTVVGLVDGREIPFRTFPCDRSAVKWVRGMGWEMEGGE